MNVWINFKLRSGALHPDEKELQESPLALLIIDCIGKSDDVFGETRPVDVWLSNDGTSGEIYIGHDSGVDFAPITPVSVNLSMFKETPLSDKLKKSVIEFFEEYASSIRK